MHHHCSECHFSPGDRIYERFQVIRKLGEGTYGCVYLVNNPEGENYAIKLLKLWEMDTSMRKQLLERFDMEYETGQIDSKYLVHSFNKGFIKGNPFILMEYCPKGDLMSAVDNDEQIDLMRVARDVLNGLGDLHKHGKVHRDLKPENVLIRVDGTAILTDFGISGDQNNRLTQFGPFGKPLQRFGTYAYMPPEQVNPRRGFVTVLPTTDVFSFGVMMFQLITNELPFGKLDNENDLPQYVENGKRGKWNRCLLNKTQNSEIWLKIIEGCLIPDYKRRLQDTNAVLDLLPYQRTTIADEIPIDVQLRIMQGEEYNKKYLLSRLIKGKCKVITLGRDSEDVFNDIAIKETLSSYISRCHCTLEFDTDKSCWVIRDGQWRNDCSIALRSKEIFPCKSCDAICHQSVNKYRWKSSKNGTFLNSTEVDSSGLPLKKGDIISIGNVTIRVEGF